MSNFELSKLTLQQNEALRVFDRNIELCESNLRQLGVPLIEYGRYTSSLSMLNNLDEEAVSRAIELNQVALPEKCMDVHVFVKKIGEYEALIAEATTQIHDLKIQLDMCTKEPVPPNWTGVFDPKPLKDMIQQRLHELGRHQISLFKLTAYYPVNTRAFYKEIEPSLTKLMSLCKARAMMRAHYACAAE